MLNQFSDHILKPVGTFPSCFALQEQTWEALRETWTDIKLEFGSFAAELPDTTINELFANIKAKEILMENLKGLRRC